jgi:cold-inducible RNA-binding protein
MNTRLYVGNLSYSTNDASLKDMFSQAGEVVSASIVTDRMTGRSKGFGFVEMTTADEAQAAISMFNEKEVDGRNLTVNEARPKEERPRGNFGGGDRGGNGRSW